MSRIRNIGRKRLQASTLMETITASIIFMIVFVMAMDTLTRLLTFDKDGAEYIQVENELGRCRKLIRQSELRPETSTYLYDWGEIRVEILNYKENVFLVNMVATGKKQRTISYRFLQANP